MVEKIRPLYDRVAIRRRPHEEKTAGGLYIPDTAKEDGQMGDVVAVGVGRITTDGKVVPMQVQVGNVVLFGKYAGTKLDNDHIILREEDILGIVE